MAALRIRIKDEQRDLIERGARLRGEPLSEFVRRAACAEAEYLEQSPAAPARLELRPPESLMSSATILFRQPPSLAGSPSGD